jgi:hypothetical protein
VLFENELMPLISNLKYSFGFIRQDEAGNNTRVFFVTPYLELLARWLLSFTNGVTAESPTLLKTILQDLAEETTVHYKSLT